MNNLLSKQRRWLSLILLLEILGLVALFLVSFFLPDFPYYFYVGLGLTGLYIIVDTIFILSYNLFLRHKKGQAELKAASIIGNDINEAYNFGELGLAVCDHDNNVIWVNDFMASRFTDIIDENIYSRFSALERLADPKHKFSNDHPHISYENRTYEVELIREARLFIFRDITDFANIYSYNQKQSPVVGYIAIDNYSDVQMYISDDVKFVEMQTFVNETVTNFASEHNALLRKIKDDRFLFVTTKENYEKIHQEKFAIVDLIAKKYPNTGFTISMGIALGFPDYARLASMASSALDVALTRGGDQVVVDNHGQPLAYYGGKTDLMPSRNRVKTRTLSNSLLTILKNYRNVVIMGHITADFDAIASGLAVQLLCKTVGVDAKICWEDQFVEDKCRRAIELRFSKSEREEMFVRMRDVDSLIHDKTLLFLVDHSNPYRSIFKEYVKKFDNVAIIDHHQPGNVVADANVFYDVDTSASSASEILTSFLIYNPNNIEVDERTATFLLSGICLDTHFYREHATNATFEASAKLKDWGADSGEIVDFMKEDLEEYRQKVGILDTGEVPYTGIYVTMSPDDEIVSEVSLSRVADESLSIRGIQASFCIGRINPHTIKVSARSDGTVNVATLMEKLGKGGGRFVASAAAITDAHVSEVREMLGRVLKDYLEDAKINNLTTIN